MSRRCIRLLLSLLLLCSVLALPGSAADSPPVFRLTILHDNDFHGADPVLLARRATLVKRIRAAETNVLLLEAGDVWTRGPYAAVFFGEMEFAALNAMGYDAMTLGNNEFKATGDVSAQAHLQARIRQASFPILCANITVAQDGAYLPGVKPYLVKTLGGLRLGLIGLSSTKIRDYPQALGYSVADPLDCARMLVPKLQAETDAVLALTHIGYGQDLKLARTVKGLAAIVGGDTHLPLPPPVKVDGTPIVQAGSEGRYLGRLDLTLVLRAGKWTLKSVSGRLLPVDKSVPPDPEVLKIIEAYLAKAKQAA